jgi:hypothetical protein
MDLAGLRHERAAARSRIRSPPPILPRVRCPRRAPPTTARPLQTQIRRQTRTPGHRLAARLNRLRIHLQRVTQVRDQISRQVSHLRFMDERRLRLAFHHRSKPYPKLQQALRIRPPPEHRKATNHSKPATLQLPKRSPPTRASSTSCRMSSTSSRVVLAQPRTAWKISGGSKTRRASTCEVISLLPRTAWGLTSTRPRAPSRIRMQKTLGVTWRRRRLRWRRWKNSWDVDRLWLAGANRSDSGWVGANHGGNLH